MWEVVCIGSVIGNGKVWPWVGPKHYQDLRNVNIEESICKREQNEQGKVLGNANV